MTALANQVILSGRLDHDPEIVRMDGGHDQMAFCIEKHAVTVIDPVHVTTACDLRSGDPVFVQGHLISDVTVNTLYERYRQTTIVVDEVGLLILMTEPAARPEFGTRHSTTRSVASFVASEEDRHSNPAGLCRRRLVRGV